jgi:hypothetical protein
LISSWCRIRFSAFFCSISAIMSCIGVKKYKFSIQTNFFFGLFLQHNCMDGLLQIRNLSLLAW